MNEDLYCNTDVSRSLYVRTISLSVHYVRNKTFDLYIESTVQRFVCFGSYLRCFLPMLESIFYYNNNCTHKWIHFAERSAVCQMPPALGRQIMEIATILQKTEHSFNSITRLCKTEHNLNSINLVFCYRTTWTRWRPMVSGFQMFHCNSKAKNIACIVDFFRITGRYR